MWWRNLSFLIVKMIKKGKRCQFCLWLSSWLFFYLCVVYWKFIKTLYLYSLHSNQHKFTYLLLIALFHVLHDIDGLIEFTMFAFWVLIFWRSKARTRVHLVGMFEEGALHCTANIWSCFNDHDFRRAANEPSAKFSQSRRKRPLLDFKNLCLATLLSLIM